MNRRLRHFCNDSLRINAVVINLKSLRFLLSPIYCNDLNVGKSTPVNTIFTIPDNVTSPAGGMEQVLTLPFLYISGVKVDVAVFLMPLGEGYQGFSRVPNI